MIGAIVKTALSGFYIITGAYLIRSVKEDQNKPGKTINDVRQNRCDVCSGWTLIVIGIVMLTLI